MNVYQMIREMLESKGCKLEESAGIVYVETPEGETWDFSKPEKQEPKTEK